VTRIRELTSPDARLSPVLRRQAEREVRCAAVAWSRAVPGASYAEKGGRLHLSARTLRHWVAGWRENRLVTRSRGRPARPADSDDVARMLGLLFVLGPSTGWDTLSPYFEHVSFRWARPTETRSARGPYGPALRGREGIFDSFTASHS